MERRALSRGLNSKDYLNSGEKLMKRLLEWQIATVKNIQQETARVKTLTLALPDWTLQRPGQHVDVRLTAPDGYQAQRSYSIASSPNLSGDIDLTVERLEDGEVSTYLHDVLVVGDSLELRGPIGGYFVWEASQTKPLLLVAGGSGIVPLMAMLRNRCAAGSNVPARLLYSSRSYEEIIYRKELDYLSKNQPDLTIFHTLTRQQPPAWQGYSRRIDMAMLKEVANTLDAVPDVYICGPTALVEFVANGLVALGYPPAEIRTERFGPTGGV
jgi:ferredoxin-NADP reductase